MTTKLNASNVDHSKPLTDEEKVFLHGWSLDHEIALNERLHAQKKEAAKGENIDVTGALEKAGLKVPSAPPPPSVPGQELYTGPVVVEGENDQPQEPGVSTGVVVPLPRDHPLTAVVDDSTSDADEPEEKWDGRAVRAEVNELTVEELKENLRDLDEPVSGNQKELQDRLVKALKKNHEAAQEQ